MDKRYCDRCLADLTGTTDYFPMAIPGVSRPHIQVDLCRPCAEAFQRLMSEWLHRNAVNTAPDSRVDSP